MAPKISILILVLVICTACIGEVGRVASQLQEGGADNVCRERDVNVTRNEEATILVAEAPTSDGQVRRRLCMRAATNFSYIPDVDYNGTSGRLSVYLKLNVIGNEDFNLICKIQIQLTPHVCNIHINVIDEGEVKDIDVTSPTPTITTTDVASSTVMATMQPTNPTSGGSNGPPVGTIVGTVCGVCVGVLVAVLVGVLVHKCKGKRRDLGDGGAEAAYHLPEMSIVETDTNPKAISSGSGFTRKPPDGFICHVRERQPTHVCARESVQDGAIKMFAEHNDQFPGTLASYNAPLGTPDPTPMQQSDEVDPTQATSVEAAEVLQSSGIGFSQETGLGNSKQDMHRTRAMELLLLDSRQDKFDIPMHCYQKD